MRWVDRHARLERAKELGRLAYRLIGSADICGIVTVDGEEKMLREHTHQSLTLDLYTPARPNASPTEFSRIVIRYHGRRVFEIRWIEARDFKIVTFEPGDEWEEALEAESEANWF